MTERNDPDTNPQASRRDALRHVGGGMALAILGVAGLGGRVLAQDATPGAANELDGGYAVIRIRTIKPDRSAEELARIVGENFIPIVRDVPGFIAYVVVANEEAKTWASIGLFTDRAAADESTRRATAFGDLGTRDFVVGDPVIITGVIGAAATSL